MDKSIVLTIAVPVYNMEKWLSKNLRTYCDESLIGKLEVIVLNNASEDRSKNIILEYCRDYPTLFKLHDRDSRGYGSSINEAIRMASGKYFRIVDADDWVDTSELKRFIGILETCTASLVQTDYCTVNMQNGTQTFFRAAARGIDYGILYYDLNPCVQCPPCIHSTTYLTSVLRDSNFQMQDQIYFVDEEYVILPCMNVNNVVFYDCNIYRYQISNPNQSTSPGNRAKFRSHREKILKRLIHAYLEEKAAARLSESAEKYIFFRIATGIGDHFTTLFMYISDRRMGREEAKNWLLYLKKEAPEFVRFNRKKVHILKLLNRCHVTLSGYERLKKLFRRFI